MASLGRFRGDCPKADVPAGMDADRMADVLIELLEDDLSKDVESVAGSELVNAEIESFRDADVLTADAGFVVALRDGSEFQVTVAQSKEPS